MKNYSHKLHIKVAISIGFGAVLATCILSFFSYFNALERVKIKNYSIVEQLVNTVKKTASIAVYVKDQELAQEIVDGLAENILISSVKLSDDQGLNITNGSFDNVRWGISVILLDHPFMEDNPIGQLSIYPNGDFIQAQAQVEAKKQMIILIVYSIVIALFVSVLLHYFFTRPLQRLTKAFSKVDPSKPHTMFIPEYYHTDEIGMMTHGINVLMGELRLYINNEVSLREKTQALEHKFRLIFERASAGICLINQDDQLVITNQAFDAMLLNGNSSSYNNLPELFEKPYDVIHYLHQIRTNQFINNFAVDLKRRPGKDGKSGWIECLFSMVKDERQVQRSQSSVLIEVIMHDITERAEREVKTRFEADHDALTHLRSRRSGERKLAELLSESLDSNSCMILMMIDLDKFKPINDELGHDAGDTVLIETGKRLMHFFHETKDLCVRWGGDEFIVARTLEQCSEIESKHIAQQLLEKIRAPIALQSGVYCNVGASIGVVMSPLHGTSMAGLLVNADHAMYKAKELGRDQCALYDRKLDSNEQRKTG